MFGMNCLDVACYYQNYEIVYLLLKYKFTTEELRKRQVIFQTKFPGQINLIDTKVQELIDYFESYMPSMGRMFLLRNLQKEDPNNQQLSKFSSLLGDLLPEEFLEIVKYYTPTEQNCIEQTAATTS